MAMGWDGSAADQGDSIAAAAALAHPRPAVAGVGRIGPVREWLLRRHDLVAGHPRGSRCATVQVTTAGVTTSDAPSMSPYGGRTGQAGAAIMSYDQSRTLAGRR